ncbi:MAG TPA: helix-turn-helix domain-containing protein [Longimicrobiales bacterium]|nr:helix-turn-helix domain-containing protein [Longimicrobiales bacterium]
MLGAAHPVAGQAFDLPLSREDMAEYLGLTIETVSRQVGRLKKAGLIELQSARRVVVLDYAALLDAAGDDSDGGLDT